VPTGNPRGKGFPVGTRPLARASHPRSKPHSVKVRTWRDGGGPGNWAVEPSATQTLFEVFDPDLESGDVLLQLGEIALQNLSTCPFIGESRLDAA
jgi:hypothetical protein